MTRADAQRLFYAVIDGQATSEEVRDFSLYLKSDPELAVAFAREKAVHEELIIRARRAHNEKAPARLRASIMSALDAVDREEALIPSSSKKTVVTPLVRLNPFVRRFAMAASLVLAVGAGYIGKVFYDHQTTFGALENAHIQAVAEFESTGKFVHTTETGKCHESANKMISGLGLKLANSVDALREVGGCINDCSGKTMGQYVYADGDKIVSVFIVKASDFQIPSDVLNSKVEKDGQTFYDHNCRGCRLVYQRVGEVIVITATTNRKVELLEFEPVVI